MRGPDPNAKARWQLPKGLVEKGETPADAAVREVREEAGVASKVLGSKPLEVVEYWYVGTETHEAGVSAPERIRFHKFVHFFLLEFVSGDVRDHDAEVEDARWVPVAEAVDMLAFKSEREIVRSAQALFERAGGGRGGEDS